MSKILALDIEWAPAKVYAWRLYDEITTPEKIIDQGGMLCFCANWVGSKDFMFFSEWSDGRAGMAKAALALLTEADAVITYNGDKYDLPKLTGEILLAGLTPPPPPTSIDLYKAVKKFGFLSNKLAVIGPLLGLGSKLGHEGFALWKSVDDGDAGARRRMMKYCIQDVRLLVRLYNRVKSFVPNHPHMGEKKHECGACGSNKVQLRGTRRTKHFLIQRVQCTDCGSWSSGKRTAIK